MYLRWRDGSVCIQDRRIRENLFKMSGWECMYLRWKDGSVCILDGRMGVNVSKMEGWE